MHQMEYVDLCEQNKEKKKKKTPCTLHLVKRIVFVHAQQPRPESRSIILITCVFLSHRTIQSNYRVILRSAQTKSHEWYPVAGREAILSSPKASIIGLQ